MKLHTHRLLLFFSFLFFAGCNDGGLYGTVNPPLDGVIIDGGGNDVSGFSRIPADAGSPSCSNASDCEMTISNNTFITLRVPVPEGIKNSTANKMGLFVDYDGEQLVYVYKKNGQNLERDNLSYKYGVFPQGASYNLYSLWNEYEQDILVRGVFSLEKTGKHAANTLLAYLSLKVALIPGQTLTICSALVNEEGGTISDFLQKPDDCFTTHR